MSLSSLQLDAFIAVTRARSFSQAAKALHITQSALSQRVLNLEEELGSTLLIRDSKGIQLTDLGQRLLQYCQSREALEQEFVARLRSGSQELAGVVRLAGFSTFVRPILIPLLSRLIQQAPKVQADFLTRELTELPRLLESGEADFIFLTAPVQRQGVESRLLGFEENVMVQAKDVKSRENVFLDHDVNDTTTIEFFKLQKNPPKDWQQHFCDDIEGIMAGIIHGYGRAVMPLHMVKKDKRVTIVKNQRPLRIPVYMAFYAKPFYTKLHERVIQEVTAGVKIHLAN